MNAYGVRELLTAAMGWLQGMVNALEMAKTREWSGMKLDDKKIAEALRRGARCAQQAADKMIAAANLLDPQ